MNPAQNNLLSKFEQYAQKAMQDWQIPGMAVAIVENDKLLYWKGFGVKKLGSRDLINEDTVFQTGSVSKTFTAALIAMLVDEGKLHWSDKVTDHLPNFRLNDPLATDQFTIDDLMSQRSGLPPHAGRLLPYLGFSRDYIIKGLKFIKPASGFRSAYAYQNNLFLVAGALIEKHTGRSWEENLTGRIFKPLGMTNTTATLEGYQGSLNVAQGHYYNGPGPGSPVKNLPMDWPYHYWVYTAGPAAGINSTVSDLARWLELFLGKGNFRGQQLIGSKNIEFMYLPKVDATMETKDETRYYCTGWLRSDYDPYPIYWHNGGTSGMKSIIAIIPEAHIGIVVLCNLFQPFLPEALVRVFTDLWFNKPPRDWSKEFLSQKEEGLLDPPGPRNPPRPLRYYAGIYYNDLYGPISVTSSGGTLILTMGPAKIRLKLQHWGGDTFILCWPGVITCGAGVQFYANKFGEVDTIAIEGMNDDLTGVFKRKR